MSSITRSLRTGAIGLALLLSGQPSIAAPNDPAFLNAQYDSVVRDCQGQLERGELDGCLTALQELSTQLGATGPETHRELKTRLQMRIGLVEARKQAAGHQAERPDLYYKTIFKAYAAVPEKYFPYDEVMPLWNQFLRHDGSRARFARYRKLKFIVKAPKEDKALEDTFFATIQERLLLYGFSLMDPTTATSIQPDVLLKVDVKGTQAEGSTDPRLQHKKVYRITIDVTTFKFLSANSRIEPVQEELEQPGGTLEVAREQVIKKGTDRVSDLLFYHTLREMFPAAAAE